MWTNGWGDTPGRDRESDHEVGNGVGAEKATSHYEKEKSQKHEKIDTQKVQLHCGITGFFLFFLSFLLDLLLLASAPLFCCTGWLNMLAGRNDDWLRPGVREEWVIFNKDGWMMMMIMFVTCCHLSIGGRKE
jgi:hypothetical protein